jgi:hypothetical protein
MNRDLFLAILAMDSYNRGLVPAINRLKDDIAIGIAAIKNPTTDQMVGWQDAGFYAISYDVPQGTIDGLEGIIIAYRGSDYEDTGGIGLQQLLYGNDIWKGWRAAFGFPFGGQPALALEFYEDITGQAAYNSPGHRIR